MESEQYHVGVVEVQVTPSATSSSAPGTLASTAAGATGSGPAFYTLIDGALFGPFQAIRIARGAGQTEMTLPVASFFPPEV